MSKLFFSPQLYSTAPKVNTDPIIIKSPPIMPTIQPQGVWRKILPIVIAAMIIALFLLFIFASFQSFSLQNLLYPFIILLLAIGVFQGTQGGADTAEINHNRRVYLNYLITIRDQIIERESQQKTYLNWLYPDPKFLLNYIGQSRQWERSLGNPYFMHVRVGRGPVKLSTPLKLEIPYTEEVYYEPVCAQAITELFKYHGTLYSAPYAIDITESSVIYLVGEDYDKILSLVRALTLELAIFHDQYCLKIGAFSPHIEEDSWGWLKWLPHCDIPHEFDSLGTLRFLYDDYEKFMEKSRTFFVSRSLDSSYEQDHNEYFLLLMDFYHETEIPSETFLNDLTSIRIIRELPQDRDINFNPRVPYYLIRDNEILQWKYDRWESLNIQIDSINEYTGITMARRLSKWDSDQVSVQVRHNTDISNGFVELMGISDASNLEMNELWAPKYRDEELVIPLGIQENGSPLILDMKEGDEGGIGPHGLIIGMTGSGKSQLIAELLLALFLKYPADRIIVIYADFKGEAEADSFRDFPQIAAIISNMADKRYIADRFAETLTGVVERRELLLREAGRTHNQGVAFKDVQEYEEAISEGADLPPIPTLLIVADEFTLMLREYPEYAELFDMVARKGRSLRIHILFASQTLDIGRIKDIDKNVNYRICLKVADMGTSRQIIGTDQAYFIDSSKESQGVGYLVKGPGTKPIRFRSAYVRGNYFSSQESPLPEMPITQNAAWFTATSAQKEVFDFSPNPQHYDSGMKLISLVNQQLSELEPKAPILWLPPLDTPISLGSVQTKFKLEKGSYCWPLGEIDLPRLGRRDILIYDTKSAQGNLIIHGGPQSGKSTALLTFILSAAQYYNPAEVQFYCISAGGNALARIEDLDHTVAVGLSSEEEKMRRIFNQLENILEERKNIFKVHKISDLQEFRELSLPDISTAEIFVVLDEIYLFSKHTTEPQQVRNPYMEPLIRLISEGASYGIHLIASSVSWMYLPIDIQHNVGMRLELKLSNPNDTSVRLKNSIYNPQDSIPDMSGRGITMKGEHFLFFLPCLDQEENSERLNERIDESVQLINQQYAQSPTFSQPIKLELLPTNIPRPAKNMELLRIEKIPFGVGEKNLNTICHDFREHPLLLIVGDQKSGKTNLLRLIIEDLTEMSSQKPVAAYIIDKRLQLSQLNFPEMHEYIPHIDQIISKNQALAAFLNDRRPPADLSPRELASWSFDYAPQYFIIDDVDFIPDSPNITGPHIGERPWGKVLEFLSIAQDIGLRVIVTAKATNINQLSMTNQLLRAMSDLNSSLILLNSKNAREQIRNIKLMAGLNPGRALYIPDMGVEGEYVQIFNSEPENAGDD